MSVTMPFSLKGSLSFSLVICKMVVKMVQIKLHHYPSIYIGKFFLLVLMVSTTCFSGTQGVNKFWTGVPVVQVKTVALIK